MSQNCVLRLLLTWMCCSPDVKPGFLVVSLVVVTFVDFARAWNCAIVSGQTKLNLNRWIMFYFVKKFSAFFAVGVKQGGKFTVMQLVEYVT